MNYLLFYSNLIREKLNFMYIDEFIFLSIILSSFFVVFLLYSKKSFSFISFISLPGTFMHEFMHLFFSLILNGKPVSFSIIPKKKNILNLDGKIIGYQATLGSVGSKNITWYNGAFIALSPFLLYLFAFFLFENIYKIYLNYGIYYYFFTIYLISNFIFAGFPSITDWKLAIKNSLLLFILLFIILIYYFNLFNYI